MFSLSATGKVDFYPIRVYFNSSSSVTPLWLGEDCSQVPFWSSLELKKDALVPLVSFQFPKHFKGSQLVLPALLWHGLSKSQIQCSRCGFTMVKLRRTITLLSHLVRILLILCHNAVWWHTVSLLTHGEFAVSQNPQVFSAELLLTCSFPACLIQFLFTFPFFPLLYQSCIFLHFTSHFSAEVLSNCLVSKPRLKSRRVRICLQQPWRLTLPSDCLPGQAFQCCIWWMSMVMLSLTPC